MKYFNSFFTIAEPIAFIPEWKGMSYGFERLTESRSMRIPTDMIFASHDNLGRRLLIRGSRLGNLVLFERYAPGQNINSIHCNLPGLFHMHARGLPPGDFTEALNDVQMNYLIQGDF